MTTEATPTPVWHEAVKDLTNALGTLHRSNGDFSEGLTLALAAAAANAGGCDALTASRPGSWEADFVQQILTATVGSDDLDLWRHRTDPLTIAFGVYAYFDAVGYLDGDGMEMLLDAERLEPLCDRQETSEGVVVTPRDQEAYEAALAEVQAIAQAYQERYAREATEFLARFHAGLLHAAGRRNMAHLEVNLLADQVMLVPEYESGSLEMQLIEAALAITAKPKLPLAEQR